MIEHGEAAAVIGKHRSRSVSASEGSFDDQVAFGDEQAIGRCGIGQGWGQLRVAEPVAADDRVIGRRDQQWVAHQVRSLVRSVRSSNGSGLTARRLRAANEPAGERAGEVVVDDGHAARTYSSA